MSLHPFPLKAVDKSSSSDLKGETLHSKKDFLYLEFFQIHIHLLGRIKWEPFTHFISVLSTCFFCIVGHMAVIYSKDVFIGIFIFLKIMKYESMSLYSQKSRF